MHLKFRYYKDAKKIWSNFCGLLRPPELYLCSTVYIQEFGISGLDHYDEHTLFEKTYLLQRLCLDLPLRDLIAKFPWLLNVSITSWIRLCAKKYRKLACMDWNGPRRSRSVTAMMMPGPCPSSSRLLKPFFKSHNFFIMEKWLVSEIF